MRRQIIITGFMLLGLVFCWLGGFMLFCREVFFYADKGEAVFGSDLRYDYAYLDLTRGRRGNEFAPDADDVMVGIVALTGGRNRIAKALELLDFGMGDRLLISGVKSGTGWNQIAAREDVVLKEGQLVDLGYQATDTVGNAIEVKAWAAKYKIDKLAVVTSFYHIPRARLELAHVMPEKDIRFYAVQSPFVLRRWWSSVRSFLFLAAEYTKFLAVYVQYYMLGL
ncbi:MAG: YdcF family protein [Acetobacter sp.]|nr:YdcF family protein [Acetobacter sp.]